MMRAAVYERQGAAAEVLKIVDLPQPSPGPGEVRIRIHASGVNPADCKARAGTRGDALQFPLIIPHHDGAGVIDAVGPGVSDRTGERVWVWNAQVGRAFGTAAEWVVLPQAQVVRLPESVSLEHGACLGIPALTAMRAVQLAPALDGKIVLVAGAGAVGAAIIRLAAFAGAIVVALISSEEKASRARAAGARLTINRHEADLATALQDLTGGECAHVLFDVDAAINAANYHHWVASHGSVIVYGTSASEAVVPVHWLMRQSVDLRPFLVFNLDPIARSACVRKVTKFIENGVLTSDVAGTISLEKIVDAHELVESGQQLGNVVVTIP